MPLCREKIVFLSVMENHFLHLISFNIPYPPDYGGIIDVYYKIKALQENGVKIILHAFEYDKFHQPSEELEKICHKIFYYRRKKNPFKMFSLLPFIVNSRESDDLLKNLSEDKFPILFEGLHACIYLNHEKLSGRIKIVRMHNIEWKYYKELGKIENNLIRKIYFKSESWKLKRFELILKRADSILAISKNDWEYLYKKFSNVDYIPAFHGNDFVNVKTGKGSYALYHANLSVGENVEAVRYLLNEVFNDLPFQLIIAGKNQDNKLLEQIKIRKNVVVEINPSERRMKELIKDAHINILPVFRQAGMKLKLLNALYNGRFCLTNTIMVENTGVEQLCEIANSSLEFKSKLIELFNKDFTSDETNRRKKILEVQFFNTNNARRIKQLIHY